MRKNIKSALFLFIGIGLFSITGCTTKSATIAEYSGGELTESQFIKELKSEPSSKTVLANLLIYTALNNKYGKKINQSLVKQDYNSYKSKYGKQFDSFLSQNSYTRESFKRLIKINYLSHEALKEQIKPTNKQLKNAWKTYQPNITVQHILTTDESTANKVISELKDGKNFETLASTYSIDNVTNNKGGKLASFNITDKNLDSSFKLAAYKLKNGEYTQRPIKVTNGYEVIKMLNHPSKGSFKQHKKDLINQLYEKWSSNSLIMRNVISQVLKDEKVTIKDKELQSALDAYKGTTKKALNSTK